MDKSLNNQNFRCQRCKIKEIQLICSICSPFNFFCNSCDTTIHSLPSKKHHKREFYESQINNNSKKQNYTTSDFFTKSTIDVSHNTPIKDENPSIKNYENDYNKQTNKDYYKISNKKRYNKFNSLENIDIEKIKIYNNNDNPKFINENYNNKFSNSIFSENNNSVNFSNNHKQSDYEKTAKGLTYADLNSNNNNLFSTSHLEFKNTNFNSSSSSYFSREYVNELNKQHYKEKEDLEYKILTLDNNMERFKSSLTEQMNRMCKQIEDNNIFYTNKIKNLENQQNKILQKNTWLTDHEKSKDEIVENLKVQINSLRDSNDELKEKYENHLNACKNDKILQQKQFDELQIRIVQKENEIQELKNIYDAKIDEMIYYHNKEKKKILGIETNQTQQTDGIV